jgi:hypothetical protein
MSARSFENFVNSKLVENGDSNDYLVNFKELGEWASQAIFKVDSYPYPTKEESHNINEKFQQFFDTVQERTDEETGNVALFEVSSSEFRVPSDETDAVSLKAIETLLDKAGIGVEYVSEEEAQRRYNDVRKASALETVYSLSEKGYQQTAISSADGAKILQNLEKLKEKLLNLPTHEKTFIGEVADALGIDKSNQHKASKYATFETINGKIVTIRLSNHNATVSNFDNHGEKNGISIVVTPKENLGITNDGNAHVVEYFYDAIKLRRAEGKPLAEIINSIQQALYSGEYKDTTGLAEVEEVNKAQFHSVWHGSPHLFDKFSTDFIGAGEGVQAYGWGLYFTDKEGIARSYANITHPISVDDVKGSNILVEKLGLTPRFAQTVTNLARYNVSISPLQRSVIENTHYDLLSLDTDSSTAKENGYETIDDFKKAIEITSEIDNIGLLFEPDRNLYKVKIHGDKTIDELNFIRWDKPLWNIDNAIETIKNQLETEGFTVIESSKEYIKGIKKKGEYDTNFSIRENQSGEQVYGALSSLLGSDKEASLFLLRAGIDGIIYPTEFQSKGEHDDSFNYVVFDENAIEIEEHVQFFTRNTDSPDSHRGVQAPIVYGWTENGKIYLVKEHLNPETPIHEYSHIWDISLQKNNPKLWKHGVELLKQTKLWDKVKNDPNYSYLKNDNEVASEVKARLVGKEGAKLFAEMQKDVDSEKDLTLKAKATKLIHDIKKWLSDTWYCIGLKIR